MSLSNIMTFDQFVTMIATANQAAASEILDFTQGSVLLANSEASANVGTFMQTLFVQLLATTRAATCKGNDLDTFVADFGGPVREAATFATGNATLSRYSTTAQAIIYPGATVQSADGKENYAVGTDTANILWNSTIGGYVVPIGTASITVPITAQTAGSEGNAAIGVISVITSPIPNIDSVTNSAALTNGLDVQTDAAYLKAFQDWIQSLSSATLKAIMLAISSLGQNMTGSVVENEQVGGAYEPGFFYAVINDGTGSPSSGVIAAADAAIDAVRPFTVRHTTIGPTSLAISISLTLTLTTGADSASINLAVQNAIVNFVNGLAQGATFSYAQIAAQAFGVSAQILNVTDVLLNGGTADIAGAANQVYSTTLSAVVVS